MKTDGTPAARITAGYNSSLKLIKNKEAECVFLAFDCSDAIKEKVREAAALNGIAVDETMSMSQLSALCGIDVGCAVCAVRKK